MIWLGLALPLAFVPGYTGATIPTGWAMLSIILPWFLWRKTEVGCSHWLGLAFGVYATSSLAWAPRTDDAVFELWQLGVVGCAFYLGSVLCDLRRLFIGLALGLSVSSIVAICQYLGLTVVPDHPTELILRGDSLKPSGLFYNSVVLGEAVALALVGLLV